jgi:hypothetical protein
MAASHGRFIVNRKTGMNMHRRIQFGRRILSMLFMLAVCLSTVHAQHISTNISAVVQHAWVTNATAQLRTKKPGDGGTQTPIFDLKHFELNQLGCKISHNTYLLIGEDNWIYFTLHSAHDNPLVGDIVLAVDQDGNIYQSNAHVCFGTSGFRSEGLEVPVSSKDFFARFYSNDPDKHRWEKLDL